MTLVGWYLRSGIPWVPLLGCCAGALVLAVALGLWPDTAGVLLPTVLAACAAAAAFCFDEVSLPVVGVTPRGTIWRRTARLAVALLPLTLWIGLVAVGPGGLPLAMADWGLVGFAAIGLTAGLGALASRHAIAAPGGSLAAGAVLAVISPLVVCAFLGWSSPYPIENFSSGVTAFWMALGAAAVLLCIAGLRPGPGSSYGVRRVRARSRPATAGPRRAA